MNTRQQINSLVGNIDLYLLDYILKDKFSISGRLLDAGCGEGRNLLYFVKNGFEVYGMDMEPLAIRMVRMMYRSVPSERFVQGDLENIPFEDAFFDLVISSAVLHFASSEENFMQQWNELTRVTCQGGLLFLRMASRWGGVPDSGFNMYLTDELLARILDAGWKLNDPAKTVLVDQQRSMSVLLLERR